MKNIIAFSLWGENLMYWKGAVENIKLVKKYYQDFICRFYIDEKSRPDLINMIQGDNVEVVLMQNNDTFKGVFWRFLASEDPNVDIFLCRDCDSRISQREVDAVNEWLLSDKDFHIMRDHPCHAVPILGGMWGCRNNIMKDIQIGKLIENYGRYNYKGVDQDFLRDIIYPIIKTKSFEHSEFNLNYGSTIYPFPTERINYEFVGEIYDENNNRNQDHINILKNYYNKN